MKILFIHPNMPGQYKHLAKILAADKANEVVFMTNPKPNIEIENVKKIEYKENREVDYHTHRYLIPFERGVIASQEVWRVCKELKKKGFTPDVICGHLGWGDGMFLKDIYPDTPVLAFLEYFYNGNGADVGFLDDGEVSDEDKARIRMKNALHLYNLTYCDWGICPTFFQLQQHPKEFFSKISVLHDGVDTDEIKGGVGNTLHLPSGISFKPSDEVITYIARNFEPYRGFPEFMRGVEEIQKRRPNAHIICVGQDDVSYGRQPESGKTFRQEMMDELDIDESRFHVLGYLPHDQMQKILHISSAHIYLTVPFVLSWSMMEAMASECVMICSNTTPVTEVIEHEKNGLLIEFFDKKQLADTVDKVLNDPKRMKHLGVAARQTILDKYSLDKVLPLHIELIKDLANGKNPPPAAKKILKINPLPDGGLKSDVNG